MRADSLKQKRSWNLKTPKTWEDQPQVVETLHPTEDATLEQHQQQHYGMFVLSIIDNHQIVLSAQFLRFDY